jgi:hypothetical protein
MRETAHKLLDTMYLGKIGHFFRTLIKLSLNKLRQIPIRNMPCPSSENIGKLKTVTEFRSKIGRKMMRVTRHFASNVARGAENNITGLSIYWKLHDEAAIMSVIFGLTGQWNCTCSACYIFFAHFVIFICTVYSWINIVSSDYAKKGKLKKYLNSLKTNPPISTYHG